MRRSSWMGFVLVSWMASVSVSFAARHAPQTSFRAEAIKPGQTTLDELKKLVGKPSKAIREGASREYLFYDLGQGSAMDATVCVYKGVVEYVSYLCRDSIKEVSERFEGERAVKRTVANSGRGYSSQLSQILYEEKGRGYLYEPKTQKVRACVAWVPGRKFDTLGR